MDEITSEPPASSTAPTDETCKVDVPCDPPSVESPPTQDEYFLDLLSLTLVENGLPFWFQTAEIEPSLEWLYIPVFHGAVAPDSAFQDPYRFQMGTNQESQRVNGRLSPRFSFVKQNDTGKPFYWEMDDKKEFRPITIGGSSRVKVPPAFVETGKVSFRFVVNSPTFFQKTFSGDLVDQPFVINLGAKAAEELMGSGEALFNRRFDHKKVNEAQGSNLTGGSAVFRITKQVK